MNQDDMSSFWNRLSGEFPILRRPSPPPAGHTHLEEEDLWALAGYDGGPLSEDERAACRQALECSQCFNRLAQLRHLVQHPEQHGIPNIPVSLPKLESVLQKIRAQVVLEWVGASLVTHWSARTALRVRSPVRTRGGLRGAVQAQPALTETFGPYKVTLTIRSEDAATRSWSLQVAVTTEAAQISTEGLSGRLYKDGAVVAEKAFEGDPEISFSGLEAATYLFELVTLDQAPFALIEFLPQQSTDEDSRQK